MLSRADNVVNDAALEALFAPIAGRKAVGLAVSGGVDSLALMVLAQSWAALQTRAPELIVYTLDHGLRPEAADETALVARCAKQLGLKVRVLTWTGDKPETGLQSAARQARYRLIGAAMDEDSAEVLLTGHHAQDQAETLLMRMAHGSGIAGLAGMPAFAEVEGVPLFRPLLDLERTQLEQVVVAQKWKPVDDPSNENSHYERVRWRKLLPQLAAEGLDAERLGRLAQRMARADDALKKMADATFASLGTVDHFGIVRIDADGWVHSEEEIRVRLVQKALWLAGDRRKPFALGQIELLAESLMRETHSPTTLHGCRVSRGERFLVFAREAGRLDIERVEIASGEAADWEGRFTISNSGTQSVSVVPASALTRAELEAVDGVGEFLMAEIGAVPVVCNAGGRILAVGTLICDASIRVTIRQNHALSDHK